jgi:MacB-like periplasmic core domain
VHHLKKVRLRLRSIFRRNSLERELDAELRFHLDQQIQENLTSGMEPEEAHGAALRAIGGISRFQEECRDMRRVNFIEDLAQDLRFGIRSLLKSPTFTAIVVLTLTLGIGATTAVFSVINAVLLRPLPYKDPARLVWIHDGMTPHDTEGWPACMADYLLWRERARSFSQLAGYDQDEFALAGEGDVERVPGALVTARFFDLLGIRPVRGRTFASDADLPGKAPWPSSPSGCGGANLQRKQTPSEKL